jgi:hypothetical protein
MPAYAFSCKQTPTSAPRPDIDADLILLRSSDFLPVILAGGGFSTETSLILSAPPYVFAAIYTFAVSLASFGTFPSPSLIKLPSRSPSGVTGLVAAPFSSH